MKKRKWLREGLLTFGMMLGLMIGLSTTAQAVQRIDNPRWPEGAKDYVGNTMSVWE